MRPRAWSCKAAPQPTALDVRVEAVESSPPAAPGAASSRARGVAAAGGQVHPAPLVLKKPRGWSSAHGHLQVHCSDCGCL